MGSVSCNDLAQDADKCCVHMNAAMQIMLHKIRGIFD